MIILPLLFSLSLFTILTGKIIVTTTAATSTKLTSSKQEREESVAKLVNNISHNVHIEDRNTYGQQNSHDRYENASENINYITTTTTTATSFTSNKLQYPSNENTSVPLSSTSPSPSPSLSPSSSTNSVNSSPLDSTSLLPTIYPTNYTSTQFGEKNLSTSSSPATTILPYWNSKKISLVKILWHKHGIEEATWEPKDAMKEHYPNLFTGKIFGDENP